jgi:transcription antitermination factor NusG
MLSMDEQFKPGDRVKVSSGTFESFIGVVLPAGSEAKTLEGVDEATAIPVEIDVFGRKVPVGIPPDLLAIAPDPGRESGG